MSSIPLLNDIKTAYQRAYLPHGSNTDHEFGKICRDDADNRPTAGTREDACRQLEEHLSFLCTSILIGGEQFVREFPSHLYVLVLTDILVAAHVPAPGSGDGANPLAWDEEEGSVASAPKRGRHPCSAGGVPHGKGRSSATQSAIQYVGFQMASPIELLATRALALIAGDVPRGSYALRTAKSPQCIPVLVDYLRDPEFLVINDELTEELLKCFLYLTLIAHDTCVEANVPRRIVELLLVVEQHHLRLLCVQILSNMLARARETELGDVWAPVLSLFVESLSTFILNSPYQPENAAALSTDNASAPHRSPFGVAASRARARRAVTLKDQTLLLHYIESIVHALDRLFVEVAAMECHIHLIEQFIEVSVQLLRTSVLITPLEDRWATRSLALSPLITLYLISPTFAVPLLQRLHTWEAVCGCMLAAIEQKQLVPSGARMAAPPPSAATDVPADATAAGRDMRMGNADVSRTSAIATTASLSSSSASSTLADSSASSSTTDADEDASSMTAHEGALAQSNAAAITRSPVLTTNVMTIPFISDEQELLPLLEFLLVLMPCARRGHSHFDYRNTTGPHFRWTWEDDFHNEMECNESLSRRLERVYQQTRRFRSHGRYAMTYGKQRVFYADFLSKIYLSDRKQRHALHRRPLIAGYVHDSCNALLNGCTCCAASPDPLFVTWTANGNMQLRPVDATTGNSNSGAYTSDNAVNSESATGVGGACLNESRQGIARSSPAPSSPGNPHVPDRDARGETHASHPGHRVLNFGGNGGDGGATVNGVGRYAQSRTAATMASSLSEAQAPISRRRSGDDGAGASRNHARAQVRDTTTTRSYANRSSRQVAFLNENDDEVYEEGDEDSEVSEDDLDTSFQGSRRSGFSLCSCSGRGSTAPHRAPAQRLRVPSNVEATSSHSSKHPPITITLLPLETMLEDPMEKLQRNPATRNAFLGKDVLSHLVPTVMPALLSLLENCVNPLVARHSLILLLRCLSLCADLRTQVTRELIEIPLSSNVTASTSAKPSASAGAASTKDKSNGGFASFRKWITGSSGGTTAPRWMRTEWQTTQTALQCFLPSLRDLFVGFYLMEGVHIVAGRQDVFGSMKDDLLMIDELARVHLATEFCSFQLSVPSEQLTTSADAMVLLMGLFPKAKPAIMPSPASSKASTKNSKKSSSVRRYSQYSNEGAAAASKSRDFISEPPASSLIKHQHDLRTNEASGFSPLRSFPIGSSTDVPMLSPFVPATAATSVEVSTHDVAFVSSTDRVVVMDRGQSHTLPAALTTTTASTPPTPASLPIAGGAQASSKFPRPPLSSLQSPINNALALKSGNCGSMRGGPNNEGSPCLPPATPLGDWSSLTSNSNLYTNNSAGVFTAHQATLLLSYAQQVVSRGPHVRATAAHIEQVMQANEFKTVVVLGSSEANVGSTTVPLRVREFTLRMLPSASCPYHFTFPHCTENFFDATLTLFQALIAHGVGSSVAAAPQNNSISTVTARQLLNKASTSPERLPSLPQQGLSIGGTAASRSPVEASFQSRPTVPSTNHDSPPEEGRNRDRTASRQDDNNSSNNNWNHDINLPESCTIDETPSTSPHPFPPNPAQRRRTHAPLIGRALASVVEEDLPVHVTLAEAPKTVDIDSLYSVTNTALAEAAGPYHRLPPPLRAVLTLYDYCKEHDIELRAVLVEEPYFVRSIADTLQQWFNTLVRMREDESLSSSTFMWGSTAGSQSSGTRTATNCSSSLRVRLDSTARGKILRLVTELGATVSRDLGLATFNLDPSIVVKQPCSFSKRLRRMKAFGTVRHLVCRPLLVSFKAMNCGPAYTITRPKTCEGDRKPYERPPAVTVRNVTLPVVGGVRLRKAGFAVLPNTTMGGLAAALAKQLQLPASSPATPPLNSYRRPAPRSSEAMSLHAVQERQHLADQWAVPVSPNSSSFLTSKEFFEDATGNPSRAITADRILLFIDNEPMLSPLTTLLDALTSYAETGYSMRYLVTLMQQPGDSEEVHRNKLLMTLPTLAFWLCKHEITFVVLQEPLPSSLLTGCTLTSLQSVPNTRRCGCAGMDLSFFCSPRHLFEIAPVNGSVALYAVLTAIARSELADEASVLDSSQRRLSSAVVHQLYQHLSMFMLPPLLYSCGIGGAIPGSSISAVTQARSAQPDMVFPTASYALWTYPFMFSMDMRVSILRFFISVQRSLTLEHCKQILQSHRNLLVRRVAGDQNFGAEEPQGEVAPGQGDGASRRLDIVGLEWLSEDVLRRRRVTLTVDRRCILQSAEQLFVLASCTLTLDVAFKEEAGIGPGPAMEFYELVAEELLKPKYGLFRTEEIIQDDEVNDEAGVSPLLPPAAASSLLPPSPQLRRRSCNPLYPAGKQTPQSLHYWELLGLLLGRLLMMGETTSLNFHPLFLRRMLGEEIMVNATAPVTSNLELLDGTLAASLRQLKTMSEAELGACDLYFTIPTSEADGFSPATDVEVPMMDGGDQRRVTKANVEEYVTRMHSYYLQTVPDLALLYLRRGLQHTVNPLYLELFSAAELGRLFGSSQDAKIWDSRDHFARNIEAGHGYHKNSDVVQYLLDIVPQWDAQLQHKFLKFVTGSSCVPYGGLSHPIKVVRRDINPENTTGDANPSYARPSYLSPSHESRFSPAHGGTNPTLLSTSALLGDAQNPSFAPNIMYDHALPTVSTCFLYLKLPQYSSKSVLEERLRFAVCEGSNFFALT